MSAIGGEENEDENVGTHEDVTRKVKRERARLKGQIVVRILAEINIESQMKMIKMVVDVSAYLIQ